MTCWLCGGQSVCVREKESHLYSCAYIRKTMQPALAPEGCSIADNHVSPQLTSLNP